MVKKKKLSTDKIIMLTLLAVVVVIFISGFVYTAGYEAGLTVGAENMMKVCDTLGCGC